MVGGLPSGTVTFLFTDIEGSTRRWEEVPGDMSAALARHDAQVRSAIERSGGAVFATGGDGFCAVFPDVAGAITAATDAQLGLSGDELTRTLRVRMGLHTGEAEERDGDYFGPVVNRAARLMAAGHGGQVLLSSTTAALLPRDARVRDLGEHQLKDLEEPIAIAQLLIDGLDDEHPPLRTLDDRPGNLPVQLSSFVGRSTESDQLLSQIAAHRAVTLVGVGGTGKTRLSLHVGEQLSGAFDDGVWLIELSLARSAEALWEVAMAAFGLRLATDQRPEDRLAEHLAESELLVLVDNCEHLLDPAAELIELLLRSSDRARVLATSREALAVPGEHIVALRPLAVDDGHGDAVDLFVERLQAERGGAEPTEAERDAIVDLCRHLDGMPLAIELAAARCRSMGVADIAARLDERFRLLTGGRRRTVERHQTLEAALDWSYQLLSDAEQRVFDRLAVFVGDFDLAGAAALLAPDGLDELDTLDAVSSLVDKSMCTSDPTAEPTTYRYLETMRAYGRAHLIAEGRLDEVRTLHAQHFGDRAAASARAMVGPDERHAAAAVEHVWPDFRAAFDWALEAQLLGVLDQLGDLAQLVAWRGHQEPQAWFYARRHDLPDRSIAREAAIGGAFMVALDVDWIASNIEPIAATWSAPRPPLDLFQLGGWAMMLRGDMDRTLELHRRLAANSEHDDVRVRFMARWPLAVSSAMAGIDATSLAEEVIELGRTARWPTGEAAGWYALGRNQATDDPAAAEASLRTALVISREAQNSQTETISWREYLGVRLRAGDDDVARELVELLRHLQRASNAADVLLTLQHCVGYLIDRGRLGDAVVLFVYIEDRYHGSEQETAEIAAAGGRLAEELGDLDPYRAEAASLSMIDVVELACEALST